MEVPCKFCGEPVDTDTLGVYRNVQGWEKARKGGGTNALRLRVNNGEHAHATCVDSEARGYRRGQENLF